MSQFFTSSGQSIGVSASASVLPTEYSGLISFMIDLLAVQGALRSLIQHHRSKALISHVLSFLYGPTLISVHDYWKNFDYMDYSFDYMDLCQQSNVSEFYHAV